MNKIAVALAATLVVSACAKRPEAIAPVSLGATAFAQTSCQQATALLGQERQKLAVLSANQRSAANGDALGVFLIGVPVSSLSGSDNEGDLAVSKGKVLALETRLMGC